MIQTLQEPTTIQPLGIERPLPVSIDEVLEEARRSDRFRSHSQSGGALKIDRPGERRSVQLLWLVVAAVLVWMTWYMVRSYWAPAHPGVDQNGYQVGGKLFSQTFTTGFKPVNPYEYVGWMWVQTPDGYVYPKYPLGLPVLDAICFWIAPTAQKAIVWSYLISPICTVLASAAIFLMVRAIASSFAAILALILLASNPVALVLANNSNSHAPDLCFVMWGILCLIWWGKYGSWWRGLIAGFLLGYAMTIRYTEGLLILPLAAAVAMALEYNKGRDVRWWAVSAWMILIGTCAWFHFEQGTFPGRALHAWQPWIVGITAAIVIGGITLLRQPDLSASRWQWLVELGRPIACAAIFIALIHAKFSGESFKWKSPVDQEIVTWIFIAAAVGAVPLIYSINWLRPSGYLRHSVALFGWLVPIAALVAFNKCAMGSWTGYDTTNESDGFSWNYFADKWDFMAGQLHSIGLFFVAPLGIAGLVLMYRWSWRVALIFTLWLVPGLLLYTGYYWGLNLPGVAYLRFFLTLLPPVIVGAAWMLDHAAAGIGYLATHAHQLSSESFNRVTRRGQIVAPIAAGIIVASAAGMNLHSVYGSLERDLTIQTNIADVGNHITEKATPAFENDPAKQPILFGDQRQLLNFIQYAGEYECYGMEMFSTKYGFRIRNKSDPDAPNPLQPARVDYINNLYKNKSDNDLLNDAYKIINNALSNQRRVYVCLPSMLMPAFRSRFLIHDLTAKTLETWREPAEMSDAGKRAFMGLGPMGVLFNGGHTTPENWELLEIVRKPPQSSPPPQQPVQPAKPSRFEFKRQSKTPTTSTTKPATATTKPKAYFQIK